MSLQDPNIATRGDERHPQHAPRPRRSRLTAVLLGTVGAVAVTGMLVESNLVLPVRAENAAPLTTTEHTPAVSPMSFADIVDRVKGAVVSVKVKTMSDESEGESPRGMPDLPGGKDNPMYKFFKRFGEGEDSFGGGGRPARPHPGMAQGSGFFISPDGYLVTNNHVVENATEVSISTVDGKTLTAKVVGTDRKTDLALLKVKKADKDFPYVAFASKQPRVGDWVLAVGNPFGLGGTVTAGIVSARGRDIGSGPYDDFLQIDAPVNRGNSGGPTFNTEGQVVGVNTAIFSPSGGSVGIGFAIASDAAKNVIQSLKDNGKVARGWIGVQIQPVTDEIAESMGLKDEKGALVAEAQRNGPAIDAGIKSGDVIVKVNGETVEGPKELARKIASMGPNKEAKITYLRDGAPHDVEIKLGTLPDDKQLATAEPERPEKSSLSALGLQLAPAASVSGAGRDGVVITEVDPDGVAAQKGLKSGDVILDAGGRTVARPADISAAMATAKKEGRKAILLRIKSDQGTRYVALATKPAS